MENFELTKTWCTIIYMSVMSGHVCEGDQLFVFHDAVTIMNFILWSSYFALC